MRISFHGAAQTVTGSQHLIEVNDQQILLDCGLYQGKRAEARQRNQEFPFDPRSIDVLILSHAHIDHAGNIPNLVKQGFQGEIVCTYPTRDLCADMLRDSGHIQEKDAEFFNTKVRKRNQDRIEPLYTEEDAVASLNLFFPMPYHRPREVLPGVSLRFLEAGHMLGSAIVSLQIDDRESKREVQLVFSGDIGRSNLPIIRDPETVQHADVLILESTYGNRLHPSEEQLEDKLAQIIQRTAQRRGVLIIPAFAVGRTQQLVYALQRLVAANRIAPLPVFVDSPLATDVTTVFRNHPEVFDAETRAYMRDFRDDDPFGFSQLRYTRNVEESKELNDREGPFIVISASGMAEAGRILHHLRNRLDDPANTILITGWQAPHTLGRRLLDGADRVRIFGQEHRVRAEVVKLNGLSGHADSNELVNWVSAMHKKPQHTYLVHGEMDPAQHLAERLRNELELMSVNVPALHDTARL
ncbi:MAG: MBL fold metallo-hydrolase [Anaerolineae bacterium]|nr:MBL fold metallo-hydrolase [Anaerolineae bacterium]